MTYSVPLSLDRPSLSSSHSKTLVILPLSASDRNCRSPFLISDGSPKSVRQSVERCLDMLGGKGKINVSECGRRDPNTPCEATLATLHWKS